MGMHKGVAKVLPLVVDRGERVHHSARVGWLVPGAGLRVDFPGNPRGPVPARALERLELSTLSAAAAKDARQEVLLVFDEGRPDRPVIVGLLAPPEIEFKEGPLARAPELAEIDGRRVELRARDEIVLRCGEASITLRRNGRLVLRGTHVETCSEGVNRIRGGSVQIN